MFGLVVSCAGVSPSLRLCLYFLKVNYQAVVGDDVWLDPTEEETQLASGMLLCACMPALGTTTSVRQTGRVFPVKAFQVGDNLIFSVGSLTSRP